MAFGSVTLVPGVNVERTPTLLRAGVSVSSLIRYRDSLVQKLGGWSRYYPSAINGIPRDLHGWQDLNLDLHLSVGTTSQLAIITDGTVNNVTPQQLVTDPVPFVSATLNSTSVEITDPNVTNVTTYDAVFFNVPVSVGGVILDGLYQLSTITGTSSYTVEAASPATFGQSNPTVTNASTPSGNPTLNFAATPGWAVNNMLVYDLDTPSAIPAGTYVTGVTGSTVTMSANATGAGVGSGDRIVLISIPLFTTTANSSVLSVFLVGHGITAPSEVVVFQVSTTGNGVTIGGHYSVLEVIDTNTFSIQANAAANASGSFPMNGGNLELVYYITLGPALLGTGYGLGDYGAGAYGFGTGAGSVQTGNPITATDWTSDNWGEILLACPRDGAIYQYDPTVSLTNASVIPTAPPFNTGMFVSMGQQILVAYGSSVHEALGWKQEPLLLQWSDSGDFTNWTPSSATQAGNLTIPTGSKIVAGMAVPNQNLIWTDEDLWAMPYQGTPFIFGVTKIGAGAGAVSAHAVQQLRGSIYWMGRSNFYAYTGSGVTVIPCPVWDAVFQNLNTSFLQNIRAMPNTPFSEAGWLYPSAASASGECDSYVKVNITEPGMPWDYGPLSRSAWIDQSVVGLPIGATPQGIIFQHETSPNADGAPLSCSFTTGFFYIAEGEDFAFVDQILPDFKWTTFGGTTSASIELTFNVTNYPGDTPTSYGPYTVTQATEYISTRFRGRLMSISVASGDLNSFWRIGSIKYRYAPAGRR